MSPLFFTGQRNCEIVLPNLSPNKGSKEILVMPIRWTEKDSAPMPIPLIRGPLRPSSSMNIFTLDIFQKEKNSKNKASGLRSQGDILFL